MLGDDPGIAAEFQARGIETETGRTPAREATTLVLEIVDLLEFVV